MPQEITGERIEAAFFQLLDVTVEYVPGAWRRRGSGGARLISSGSMVNSLNGVFREGGEPVATAFGFLGGGLVGAYNIATPTRFRRRGYGRLAVEAVLRDGFDAGADGACLRSTEEGLPLYRSMGFRQIEQWTYLTSDRS